ncbi:apoptosis-stimulating of p53 protein 1-like isoform X2 [Xiphophorus hellerii]|uniref:apoptosis-stimulating of p53 protein 1-like isoform X2 n=1 Tax=Xiphophorus hellerii TaxID=8084 RepID=UPI0013B37019|nr:apoptosis-stimulating of p53 protein 1-like isoform X2 [Xiphophorus hellerii]
MLPLILTVYLNDTQQMLTEVPVTTATRVTDVVEFCKEAGESECHLAEVWNGHERPLPQELLLLDLLNAWGAQRPEVRYYLRHRPLWPPGSPPASDQNRTSESDEVPQVELTLSELQEMATRQQQQIEAQQQMLMAKEQRLRFLQQGSRTNTGHSQAEAEQLQRLKERVESQEAKLKKIRAMRGQVDYSRLINGNLTAEIHHVSSLFQEKQDELQAAVSRVEQLTQQLEDLRRGRLQLQSDAQRLADTSGSPVGPGAQKGSLLSGSAGVELRKLYQELQARNRQNLEQSGRLAQNQELLSKRTGQVAAMDRRIGELRDRLHRKKAESATLRGPTSARLDPTGGPAVQNRCDHPATGRTPAPPIRPPPITAAPCRARRPGRWAGPAPPAAAAGSSSSSSPQHVPNQNPGSVLSSPLSLQSERTDPPPAVAVRPYVPEQPSRPQSPRKGPATMNSSSIYSMYLHQPQAKNPGPLGNRAAVRAVYGKPVVPSPSPVPQDEARDGTVLPPPGMDGFPRPLSPTKLTPVGGFPTHTGPNGCHGDRPAHSQLRYQNDADLEVLRRRLSNAPRPLKKRSSITEPEGPQGPNIQKLLYQRFNTLAGGMEGGSANPFYQPDGLLGDVDGVHSANGSMDQGDKVAPREVKGQDLSSESCRSSPSSVTLETPKETESTTNLPPSTQPGSPPEPERSEVQNQNQGGAGSAHGSPPAPAALPSGPKAKRTNLKKPSSERTGHGLRVKFNPLALLLDASLEGEFDLVQRVIYEVENPSMPNDEGITPLHNAVCAGHHHIVKFLLDFGVNVNAADSDGWTPLHCAASCNSVHLCKMLVESGAAIFATTISDVETAADKCEEMEEGYSQCSQFLYGVQEKLGVMNKGAAYALWDYVARRDDELSFGEGDAITVLRRHDDTETDWWWARLDDREGYVARNLLGLYPRIKPRQRSLA